MEKINNLTELDSEIELLKKKKNVLRYTLENEFENLKDSMAPKHIFSNVLHDFTDDENLKNKAATSVVGLGSGWLAQKIFTGGSTNIFKTIAGKLLQIAVTGFVAKKSGPLVAKSINAGKKFINK